MAEIHDYPPNYQEIVAAFPKVASNRCLFAWGEDFYNPYNMIVPGPLVAHELMHGRRQAIHVDGIEGWWDEYLTDDAFRLNEEVVAHRMEYLTASVHGNLNRHARRALLKTTAARLAHPMYEYNNLTKAKAVRLLRDNPE